MRAYAMAERFPLNDFSRTTRPISTKVGRKHPWGMGIHNCSNRGLVLFGAQ